MHPSTRLLSALFALASCLHPTAAGAQARLPEDFTSRATALPAGHEVTDQLDARQSFADNSARHVRVFRLVPEQGLLVVRVRSHHIDPVLQLWDAAGRKLDENDDDPAGSTLDALLHRRVARREPLYVAVTSALDGEQGSFTICWEFGRSAPDLEASGGEASEPSPLVRFGTRGSRGEGRHRNRSRARRVERVRTRPRGRRAATRGRANESDAPSKDASTLLLSVLPSVQHAVGSIVRRQGLQHDDADDFRSWVMERLFQNDCALLRKFRGESSITTYLHVVIGNLYRDFRISRWGRWRPSARARRLGPVALRLETLLYRDGHSLSEAEAILRSAGLTVARIEIRRLAAQIPPRQVSRKPADVSQLPLEAAERADDRVHQRENERIRTQLVRALHQSLAQLEPEDQRILRMHYFASMPVSDVARTLDLDQKSLYRRLERLRARLAQLLQMRGVSAHAVRNLFEQG